MARPGGNIGSRRRWRPVICAIGLPPTRTMDGDNAINFDDWISESHASDVIDLLRPLIVGEWRFKPTTQWGRYTLKDPAWTDYFELIFTFRIDEMKIVVRKRAFPGANQPNGRFITVPIEHPHTIELLAQFVFEELSEYNGRKIVINRPILSVTG